MPLPRLYFSETTHKFLEALSRKNPGMPIYDAKQVVEASGGEYNVADLLGCLVDDALGEMDRINRELGEVLDNVPPSILIQEVLALHRGFGTVPESARESGVVSPPGFGQTGPKAEFTWRWSGDDPYDAGNYVQVIMKHGDVEVEVCRMQPGSTDDPTGCVLRAKVVVDALEAFSVINGRNVECITAWRKEHP